MHGPSDFFERHILSPGTICLLNDLLMEVSRSLCPEDRVSYRDHVIHVPDKHQVRIINYNLFNNWKLVQDIVREKDYIVALFKSKCLRAGWVNASVEMQMLSDRDTPHLLITLTYP
jgi:hypothetical protein